MQATANTLFQPPGLVAMVISRRIGISIYIGPRRAHIGLFMTSLLRALARCYAAVD